jgi:uncharacterized protein (DUF362 family)
MTNFPGKGKVAVLKTSPETVVADYARVMELAGVREALPQGPTTALKINISWQTWYPACSSTPWQIEGVARGLKAAGYNDLVGVHNDTVVVNAKDGEFNNKHRFVTDMLGIPCEYLYEENFEWFEYKPKRPFLVLDKVYPDGVFIPRALVGKNIVHLPTVKTHVFTTITGAMKNAFGGLLHRNRHWTHSVIHDTLIDLLMIQQDIHPGLFAVMDIILASADQVAIDAVSAKLQGFDPLKIRFIRKAHEMGLGVGDPREIEIVGYDIDQEPAWNFEQTDTFASKGQKMIYHGPLKPLEKPLLRTPIVPWSFFASNFYHNVYWYPFVGRPRVESALQTKWGRLFERYGDGKVVMPGMEPKTVAVAAGGLAALVLLVGAAALLRERR